MPEVGVDIPNVDLRDQREPSHHVRIYIEVDAATGPSAGDNEVPLA